tara:strand:- start:122 stop:1036 length:915 start_codon:yes stop_codon:yes gene_type:complete
MNKINCFPTSQLILEGPDLSGKTSFYNQLHEISGYRWNIQDRSALSMLVYAKLYDRDTFIEVERLNAEIKNLNNRVIILLPSWDEIKRRYNKRGDDIQTITTLKKVYRLFEEAAEELRLYPNVMVIRDDDTLSYVEPVIIELMSIEAINIQDVASYVNMFAAANDSLEASHINLTYYSECDFKDINLKVLEYEPEKEYYESILKSVQNKIENELNGNNEYNRKESTSSRRFVYSSDTCISFGQFTVRNRIFDCNFVFRSSNTKDTLKYDIQFLYYLCSEVYNQLRLNNLKCRIRINFNSAHIII